MKKRKVILISILTILTIGFILPQRFSMPVEGADVSDYHPESFWYYPWGKSVTHKGVDVFASEGINIRPSTGGLVLYSGQIKYGGNVVIILGAKWRVHYYAHLQKTTISNLAWVNRSKIIGTVGSTGNAAGKPPHLHYSIVTLIPYFWRIDSDRQGWKKMFYLDPLEYL